MVSDRSNGIYRSVVAALVGWLILVGANPPSENPRSNSGTADSNQSAQNEKDIASGIGSIGKALEAQNAKSDPYEEERNEREIRDLQAQENSAYWAKGMFWATVAALVLSFIGIGLVWTTFRETRRANSIAKETLFRQLRAYVTVESLVDERMGGGMSITLHNSGATPARGVKVVYDKLQVSDGVLSYVETEIKVADIGSQARKSITLEWYTWRDIFDAKLKIPTTLSGLLIYQPVVPDEKGCNPVLVEPFIIDLSDSEYKGDLKVEITRLPPNTRFA